MNWKVACGNSNSSSAANTPTRNTTNAEPAAGSNVNVVSAKLMEHQSRDALEHERALKSSSDNSITTGGNGDQNASMVETVAWVHVARGGAARQARSSIDNGDLLSKKEQPSTPSPEEKKMKKTGKMWGAKEKKKAKAEEAAAAAAASSAFAFFFSFAPHILPVFFIFFSSGDGVDGCSFFDNRSPLSMLDRA
mmetsp:Transcript_2913/g.10409  ORF Transcript_2913/g.10409 Transcript_2913/m.10409 type:complete len:193 (-) Transcript_2913:2876-3454(-)